MGTEQVVISLKRNNLAFITPKSCVMKYSRSRCSVLSFCLASILFTFSSCKKESQPATTTPGEIAAGNVNPSLKVVPLNIQMELAPDATGSAKQEQDLDVNGDQLADFRFRINCDFNSPSKPQLTNQVDVQSLNAESFVLLDTGFVRVIKYWDGHNPVCIKDTHFHTTKVLSFNDLIQLNGDWEDEQKPAHTLVGNFYIDVKDPKAYFMVEGKWKDVQEKYIGIRYGNRLGWIKISIPDNHILMIHEVALYR
jgi:hypothetical protein